MGSERERNRIRSSIDELPPVIRQVVDEMLADVRYKYEDIVTRLKELGFEISRSAIGRYALRSNKQAARLKAAREQTDALIHLVRDNQDIEASEIATAIMINGLTQRLATAEEEYEDIPLDKAGRLLIQLQRTVVYKERMKKERRQVIEAVERNVKSRMRQAIQGDPDLLARLQELVSEAAAEEVARDE